MTFDCFRANYIIEMRFGNKVTVFKGDRRECFNKLIFMPMSERDLAVVTVRNFNVMERTQYDISMTADDFLNADIESDLRDLALQQGLGEEYYIKLRQKLLGIVGSKRTLLYSVAV